MILTPVEWSRFWSHIQRADGDACWLWTGSKIGDFGYGGMRVDGKLRYAHIISWSIANGGEPDQGVCVLHRCDVPACVRPNHLFTGTRADNMADKIAKGRQHRGGQTGGVVLSDAKAHEILVRYATGNESVIGLAIEFGVNEATLRALVNGESWLHVPGPRLSRAEIIEIGKRNRADAVRLAKKRA